MTTKTAKNQAHAAPGNATTGAIHSESGVIVRSDAAPDPPSAADFAKLLTYGVHAPEETRHYRVAPEGFEEVARATLLSWAEISGELKLPGVSQETLQHAVDTHAALAPIEHKLEPYYRRAYDNRREADSDGMGVLYKLARAVNGTRDAALITRFARLNEWIAAHHAGPHGAKAAAGPATAGPTGSGGK